MKDRDPRTLIYIVHNNKKSIEFKFYNSKTKQWFTSKEY